MFKNIFYTREETCVPLLADAHVRNVCVVFACAASRERWGLLQGLPALGQPMAGGVPAERGHPAPGPYPAVPTELRRLVPAEGVKRGKNRVGRGTFAVAHPGACPEPGGAALLPSVLRREGWDALRNLLVCSLGTVKDTEEALYD